MIYIPIFVNIVLLLLFDYRYLFFSLISTIDVPDRQAIQKPLPLLAVVFFRRSKQEVPVSDGFASPTASYWHS